MREYGAENPMRVLTIALLVGDVVAPAPEKQGEVVGRFFGVARLPALIVIGTAVFFAWRESRNAARQAAGASN